MSQTVHSRRVALSSRTGLLLLLCSLVPLYTAAAGAVELPSRAWQHARHLQSSCDTGVFPELKPVSRELRGLTCCLQLTHLQKSSSQTTRSAISHPMTPVCRQFWTPKQLALSGREWMIRWAQADVVHVSGFDHNRRTAPRYPASSSCITDTLFQELQQCSWHVQLL